MTGAKLGATAKMITQRMTTRERCRKNGDEGTTSGIERCRHGHGRGRKERERERERAACRVGCEWVEYVEKSKFSRLSGR